MSRDLLPSLRASGVLPLYSIFLGDHCPCYIDLDGHTLFSGKTHPIAPRIQRGIQLQDPRKISAYNSTLHKQLDFHAVFKKLDMLSDAAKDNLWTPYLTSLYTKLDVTITESMKFTKRSLSRRRSNTFEWSVE